MYSGVLVTLDGSPLSEAVLPIVADLVAGTKAVVTLLTVGEVPSATIEEPLETVQPLIFVSLSAPAARFASAAPRYVRDQDAGDRAEGGGAGGVPGAEGGAPAQARR